MSLNPIEIATISMAVQSTLKDKKPDLEPNDPIVTKKAVAIVAAACVAIVLIVLALHYFFPVM